MNNFFLRDLRDTTTQEDLNRFEGFIFFINEGENYNGIPLTSQIEITHVEHGDIYAKRYRIISDDWNNEDEDLDVSEIGNDLGDLDESDDYYTPERQATDYILKNLDLLASRELLTIATVNGEAPALIDEIIESAWNYDWYNLILQLAEYSRYIPANFRQALIDSKEFQKSLQEILKENDLEKKNGGYTPTNSAFRAARAIAEAAGNTEAVDLIDRKFSHRLVKVDKEEPFAEV